MNVSWIFACGGFTLFPYTYSLLQQIGFKIETVRSGCGCMCLNVLYSNGKKKKKISSYKEAIQEPFAFVCVVFFSLFSLQVFCLSIFFICSITVDDVGSSALVLGCFNCPLVCSCFF